MTTSTLFLFALFRLSVLGVVVFTVQAATAAASSLGEQDGYVYLSHGSASSSSSLLSRPSLIERANRIGQQLQQSILNMVDGSEQAQRNLQLTDGLETVCGVIQNAFTEPGVSCECLGHSLTTSFSISCTYAHEVCSEYNGRGMTCGKPQIAISMVNTKLFSATTCVKHARRGMIPIEDSCVFVDVCPDDASKFCDCTASYGGSICSNCSICPDGESLSVDCTNINVEAISTTCQQIDLDLDFSNYYENGDKHILGFAPNFSGFCSELEASLDNNIQCDCTNAVGGNFNVQCETIEPQCFHYHDDDDDEEEKESEDEDDEEQKDSIDSDDDGDGRHCGTVTTVVNVNDGRTSSVTTCADYQDEPFGETCTSLEFCDDDVNKICQCGATYNGQACNECYVCPDGQSIVLDCSNQHELAIVYNCQPVTPTSSFEFLPNYPLPDEQEESVNVMFGGGGGGNKNNNQKDGTSVYGGISFGDPSSSSSNSITSSSATTLTYHHRGYVPISSVLLLVPTIFVIVLSSSGIV